MTPKELEDIEKFKSKHRKSKCYTQNGTGSMKFKITMEATGVGEALTIKCCGCKKKKDVTDYDGW